MSDLISRQDAVDALEHRLAEPQYQHTGEDWYVGMNSAESVIYELPAIDIVRCGECKWFDHREGCFFSTAEIDSAGFCSFGERRER